MEAIKQRDGYSEWRIVTSCSFVAVLFLGIIPFLIFGNFFQKGLFLAYVYGFTLLPLGLYLIERYSGFFDKQGDITASGWVAVCLNALFFSYILLSENIFSLSNAIFYLSTCYLLLFILRSALFKAPASHYRIEPNMAFVASVLVAGIASLGFLNTFVVDIWFNLQNGIVVDIAQWLNKPMAFILLFAVVSAVILYRQAPADDKESPWWINLVYLSPLLLFNIPSSFDLIHYDAYIGPAIAVLHGKIPLIDVFCQYGLSYLLFTLVF
ncbi:MAG: hypothetical protein RLZ35_904 [Pseudomonadota bacterium]|jgi:hypothetical protein